MRALDNLRRQWLMTLGCVLAIALSLTVPLALVLAEAGFGAVEAQALQSLEAEIILTPETSKEDAAALAQELFGWKEVAEARVKDPAMNLVRLREELSGIEGIDAAMLPTTIHVELERPAAEMGLVVGRLSETRRLPIVEEIVAGSPEVAGVVNLLAPIRWGFLSLALALGLIGLIVVANALGLCIFRRREEIEVLRHIGATDADVIKPFYAESLWIGLLGGGLSAGLLILGLVTLAHPLGQALPSMVINPTSIGLWAVPALLAAGVMMAWAGTVLSMRVYMRQVEGIAY